MELEVLSGAIKDWEGSDVTQLGEIIFMNLVHLGKSRCYKRLLVHFHISFELILQVMTDSHGILCSLQILC